eukprot:CAMPEP_0117438628 /NCGR_PEP_ID=MMETSP0759-20121206/2151_1 /TAXON_ID=63605 /ORGANISM="Percolomonas cosmopolitus, Strain WS" /LENGTH=71 /DNA_ID=CAMNT_0005230325 /DNA_START=328 /DNA_END=543 /DNA_ORIENTATION=-
MSSPHGPMMTPPLFSFSIKQQRLHLHAIRGGHLVWDCLDHHEFPPLHHHILSLALGQGKSNGRSIASPGSV